MQENARRRKAEVTGGFADLCSTFLVKGEAGKVSWDEAPEGLEEKA